MDELQTTIMTLLSAGCGFPIRWALDQFKEWKADNGDPISSKDVYRASLALSALVPSALYSIAVLAGWAVYSVPQHFVYLVAAFSASQVLHKDQSLPSRQEQENKVLEQVIKGDTQ